MPGPSAVQPPDEASAVAGPVTSPKWDTRVIEWAATAWHEIAKFGLIGLIAFIIDLGGMNLLTHTVLEGRVTTAKIASGVAATLFAWVGNRLWTFAHRANRPVAHEVSLFFLVNAIGLVISTISLVVSHYGLGFTSRSADNVSTVFGIGLATLFRFWAYKRVVFANEPMQEDTSPLHHAAPPSANR